MKNHSSKKAQKGKVAYRTSSQFLAKKVKNNKQRKIKNK